MLRLRDICNIHFLAYIAYVLHVLNMSSTEYNVMWITKKTAVGGLFCYLIASILTFTYGWR